MEGFVDFFNLVGDTKLGKDTINILKSQYLPFAWLIIVNLEVKNLNIVMEQFLSFIAEYH